MTKSHLGVCSAVALLATVCLPVSAAKAATFTYDFSITFPTGAPVSTWSGSFTLTYDPTLMGSTTGPITPSNLLTGYGTFVYQQTNNLIRIGDNCNSVRCNAAGPDLAVLNFTVDASGIPTPVGAVISDSAGNDFDTLTTVSVTLTPLPAALPLFAGGLGALGLLGWRRKRKAAAAA
jgi:hypothetical protein